MCVCVCVCVCVCAVCRVYMHVCVCVHVWEGEVTSLIALYVKLNEVVALVRIT